MKLTLEQKIDEILNKAIICMDIYCDGLGTTLDGPVDEPYPAQCQYCFEVRLPRIAEAKQQLLSLLELAKIEAKIEELKYHSLFYSGRKYSDKVDWKHEVELIESMTDNRLSELTKQKNQLLNGDK